MRTCLEENCKTRPRYGYAKYRPLYCGKHKKKEMYNVDRVFCREEGCISYPAYGYEMKRPLKCKTHKENDMKNVVSQRCKLCDKVSSFGYKKAEYCKEHKLDGMIPKNKAFCEYENCTTRAGFGIDIPRFCAKHKTEDMMVFHKQKCKECNTQPTFGFEGQKREYCSKHQKEGMVRFNHSTRCKFKGCIIDSCFGYTQKKPLFCNLHKESDMIDVVHRRCASCNLFIVIRKPLCSYCNPMSRWRTKEKTVLDYLTTDVSFPFKYNKSSGFVCGNFRPDFLFDAGTHFVIIECDENQHKQYPKSCEDIRMFNICQALGLKTVFVRYNPDSYKIKNVAKRSYTKRRLMILKIFLEKCMAEIPEENLTVHKLFYDAEEDLDIQRYVPRPYNGTGIPMMGFSG